MNVLTRELAQSIVNRTMKIINNNINVMNHEGVIIGSGDLTRIGEVHDGAVQVIEKQARVDIDEHQARKLKGTKPGVNLAIMFQGNIVGVVGITGPPEEVGKYSELIKMGAELTLEQAFLTEQIQWEERLKEDMINQLIFADPFEDPLFIERARRIALDLTIKRIAIVIEFSSETAGLVAIDSQETWKKTLSLLGYLLKKEDFIARTSPYEVVILKSLRIQDGKVNHPYIKQVMKDIIKQLHIKKLVVKAAVGNFYPTAKQWKYSYETAKDTLKVGKVLSPNDTVFDYQDYVFPVLLSEIELSKKHNELIERFEGLIAHDTKGELLETLQSYIQENGDSTKTAQRLFIHRNTLGYRLNRIHEITNRDPRKIQELIELYTAMLLAKLG